MAKSTRVTVIRPNVSVQLPHDVFTSVAADSSDAHLAMPFAGPVTPLLRTQHVRIPGIGRNA